eukprot:scaffold317_cov260-Pinguiococcus_pyrenoidosus.AAC.7
MVARSSALRTTTEASGAEVGSAEPKLWRWRANVPGPNPSFRAKNSELEEIQKRFHLVSNQLGGANWSEGGNEIHTCPAADGASSRDRRHSNALPWRPELAVAHLPPVKRRSGERMLCRKPRETAI